MTVKEFKNPMYFMFNRWNEVECAKIFNGQNNVFDKESYTYSLGRHIWQQWIKAIEKYGMYGAVPYLFMEVFDRVNMETFLTYIENNYKN